MKLEFDLNNLTPELFDDRGNKVGDNKSFYANVLEKSIESHFIDENKKRKKELEGRNIIIDYEDYKVDKNKLTYNSSSENQRDIIQHYIKNFYNEYDPLFKVHLMDDFRDVVKSDLRNSIHDLEKLDVNKIESLEVPKYKNVYKMFEFIFSSGVFHENECVETFHQERFYRASNGDAKWGQTVANSIQSCFRSICLLNRSVDGYKYVYEKWGSKYDSEFHYLLKAFSGSYILTNKSKDKSYSDGNKTQNTSAKFFEYLYEISDKIDVSDYDFFKKGFYNNFGSANLSNDNVYLNFRDNMKPGFLERQGVPERLEVVDLIYEAFKKAGYKQSEFFRGGFEFYSKNGLNKIEVNHYKIQFEKYVRKKDGDKTVFSPNGTKDYYFKDFDYKNESTINTLVSLIKYFLNSKIKSVLDLPKTLNEPSRIKHNNKIDSEIKELFKKIDELKKNKI